MAIVRKRTRTHADGTLKISWLVDYVDAAGTRRFETFYKKKEADSRLTDIRKELQLGTHTANRASITVKEAAKAWLNAKALETRKATLRNYRGYLDNHILPLLGRYKLAKLTVPVVAGFRDRLREQGTSIAVTRKVLISLKGILAKATLDGMVAQNTARDVTVNSNTRRRKLEIGVDVPSVDEVNKLLDHVGAVGGRWRRPFLVTAIFTGLRSSELRGLRWSDVDLDKKTLEVKRRADRYNEFGDTKTGAGERRVPLPPMVVNTLREWKLACPKTGGKLVLVFPTAVGTPLTLSNICNLWFYPLQVKAGVTGPDGDAKYNLHALRHFYASWLINSRDENGHSLFLPKQIQTWLGHSSITMTWDTYGHLMPDDEKDQDRMVMAERRITGN